MKHFAVFSEFVADVAEARKPYRAAHLAYLTMLSDEGVLVLGGAFSDLSGAMSIFKAEDAEAVERFVKGDPYVINNVVTSFRVREWMTVVGKDALTKVVLT